MKKELLKKVEEMSEEEKKNIIEMAIYVKGNYLTKLDTKYNIKNYSKELSKLDSEYDKKIDAIDDFYNKELSKLDSEYDKKIDAIDDFYNKELNKLNKKYKIEQYDKEYNLLYSF